MNELLSEQMSSEEPELVIEIEELEPLTVPCALPGGCMGGVVFPYPFGGVFK